VLVTCIGSPKAARSGGCEGYEGPVVGHRLVPTCHHDHVTIPGEAAPLESIVLMGDPRVTGIPVSYNGEDLADARDYGLRVSPIYADDAGDFAHVRTGLATRLLRAGEVLPWGTHLLLIEGYRPPALQRRYFEAGKPGATGPPCPVPSAQQGSSTTRLNGGTGRMATGTGR
jgi:hypothetical protein